MAAPGWGGVGRELSKAVDPKVRFQELMALVSDYTVRCKYYEAVQTLIFAEALAKDDSQKASVKSAQQQLEAVGQEWLTKYQQYYADKNYLEALTGLGLLRRTFGTLPCSISAKKVLDQAETDSNVQTALQEVKAQDLDDLVDQIIDCPSCRGVAAATGPATQTQPTQPAPVKYAKVSRVAHIQKLPADKQARAVSALEKMGKLYPLSPTGALASKDLKSLQDDTVFWTALQTHLAAQQAQSLYNAAEMYRSMGMTAKAIEYYEQLTAKFPNSALATKAKEVLAKLK